MIVVLALSLTVLGCACLYAASPNQRWLSRTTPSRSLLAAASLLLVAGLATWIAALRPLSAVFVVMHVAMVCLFAFPYAAALRGSLRRH